MAGRNLRRDGNVLMFYHPRVEDGLRIAVETKRSDTEYLLTALANGLVTADAEVIRIGVSRRPSQFLS